MLPSRPAIRFMLPLLAVFTIACGQSGSGPALAPGGSAGPLSPGAPSFIAQLPDLNSLPAAPRQALAATDYNLLNSAPLLTSPGGSANWTTGSLTLIPDLNGGRAWAVFGISGFPLDGSIFPQSIASNGGPLWLGLSRYADGRWEWRQISSIDQPWSETFGPSTGFVSPAGSTYVAIVKGGLFPKNFSSLTLTTSDALFAQPTASISLVSSKPTAEWETTFDFSASLAGDGNVTSVLFTPETGATPIELGPAMPPSAAYGHTYATGGSKQASLTILDDLGGSNTFVLPVTVADPMREVLVIYNANSQEGNDLSAYYANPETGRGIDPDYLLGLPYQPAVSPNIDRATYQAEIRTPIQTFLDDAGHAEQKANVKYLLLMRGLPHQIDGAGEFSTSAQCASVDSELCCLYSDTGMASDYPEAGFLINSPRGFDFAFDQADAFYQTGNRPFARGQFFVCYDPTWDQSNGDEQPFPLDYLVGRIDAYTYAEAVALIDRSLAADTSSTGWVVFDSTTGTYGQESDTMVDPVWPWTDNSQNSGQELLSAGGIKVFADVTTERIISTSASVPPAVLSEGVIGYAGWGVNHSGGSWPNGNQYILLDLGWNYLPGAVFSSYESFNGTAFSEPINRRGQGQICDFFRMGGTCAIGNAWEPFTIGCADERWVFERYINRGDRFIEAAYKGLRLISWMEVVVGDPLGRVKP